jgi:hypothetical protein
VGFNIVSAPTHGKARYIYDMVIPAGADPTPFEPKPLDGEVERFDVSFHYIECNALTQLDFSFWTKTRSNWKCVQAVSNPTAPSVSSRHRSKAPQIELLNLVVLIDLFIRLGYITPDNEPDFLKIVTALHTRFDYERW